MKHCRERGQGAEGGPGRRTRSHGAQTAVLVLVSVLEASLGLDVVEDLLQLLVFKPTLQTENTHKNTHISSIISLSVPTVEEVL